VLARLLQAWRPSDAGTLDRLSNVAAAMADQQQPDAELAGRLMAFMP
jgi:hypothetical protein